MELMSNYKSVSDLPPLNACNIDTFLVKLFTFMRHCNNFWDFSTLKSCIYFLSVNTTSERRRPLEGR